MPQTFHVRGAFTVANLALLAPKMLRKRQRPKHQLD